MQGIEKFLSVRSAFSFSGEIMGRVWYLILGMVLLSLVACAGGDASETAVTPTPLPLLPPTDILGDPEQGETLYQQRVLGRNGAPGCVTCHSLVEDVVLVGPSHYGLAERAAQIAPDQSAEIYLWQSVVQPDAHVTEGFLADDMYGQYATELEVQQVVDLVAYMLTLRSSTN